MTEYSVFLSSPMRGVSKEVVEMLGAQSSLFKLTSIRRTIEDGVREVAIFLKRQKMEDDSGEESKGLFRKFQAVSETMIDLKKQVTHLMEENVCLKRRVADHDWRVADHDFWLREVSTLPIFALFGIIRIYLKALNSKAKALTKGKSLEKEFNHCSKEEKLRGGPCPYYAFLHGILISNVSFENNDEKRVALEELHNDVMGIDTASLTDSLDKYVACKQERDGGGHPLLDSGAKKGKLLAKAEEMVENNVLPPPFDETLLSNLLVLALRYVRSVEEKNDKCC